MSNKSLLDQLVPLRPVVFEILLLLNDAPLHGYGLMKRLSGRSIGRTVLGPGTMYRTLKEMQQLGLIAPTRRGEVGAEPERRRYYRITQHGRAVAAAEAARMADLVGLARAGNLISDGEQA
ncbi:MAG: PadR family transcriptional regulator [Gemmatimonadota bacterium]|nr:MAG: PadR family transcriptional regulator [Gemmatimonadota bacterium]